VPLVGATARRCHFPQTKPRGGAGAVRNPQHAAGITPVIADGTGFAAHHPQLSTFWQKSHISL
jgi:hypothetical protein